MIYKITILNSDESLISLGTSKAGMSWPIQSEPIFPRSTINVVSQAAHESANMTSSGISAMENALTPRKYALFYLLSSYRI